MTAAPAPAGPAGPAGPAAAGALAGLFGRDVVYTALWAVQLLGAALVTPVATRLMDSSEFGALAAANAVMQVLFVLGGAGLATAMQRDHARVGPHRARVLFAVAAGATVVVTAAAHLTGPWWAPALGLPGYGVLLQLSLLWAATSAVTNAGLALLRSQDRLAAFACVSLAQSVLAEAASLVVLVAWRGSGATGFVVGQVLLQTAAVVLVMALAPPALPRGSDRAGVRSAIAFALPLVPVALCGLVLSTTDRLVLQGVVGPAALGGYAVAVNIASAPMLLLGVLTTSWLPRLFALGDDQAQVLAETRDAVLTLLVPVVLGLAVGGPVVMRLWAPASYGVDGLATTFAVIVVCALPYAAGAATTRRLVVSGRTGAVAWSTAVAAVVSIGANLLLVPLVGVVGAALATFAALSAQAVVLRAAAAGVAQPPPVPLPRTVAALVACGLAVLSSAAPASGGFLVLRLGLALACLAVLWLLLVRLRRRARADLP